MAGEFEDEDDFVNGDHDGEEFLGLIQVTYSFDYDAISKQIEEGQQTALMPSTLWSGEASSGHMLIDDNSAVRPTLYEKVGQALPLVFKPNSFNVYVGDTLDQASKAFDIPVSFLTGQNVKLDLEVVETNSILGVIQQWHALVALDYKWLEARVTKWSGADWRRVKREKRKFYAKHKAQHVKAA